MTDRFCDPNGGNDANDGSTYPLRVKTIGASGMTAARHAANDRIKFPKSPDPTQLSVQGTWTNASATMTLASAVNKTFDIGSSWTKSANVSGTTATGRLSNATQLIIAGAFGTGLVAYKDLGSTQDFSAYQQICFWIKSDIIIAGSTFRLDLCSDALGAVPVQSITMTQAITSTQWHAIVIDNGSALTSTCRSFALTALLDPGAATVLLNDIFAAKAPSSADCLTLYSMLSKSNAPTGVTGWYLPASISGTSIILEASRGASGAPAARTYEGSTATVTTYVRQCTPVTPTDHFFTPQRSGTEGNQITYSGGWDTTDMSTKTGQTFFIDWSNFCISASKSGVFLNGLNYLSFEDLGFVGFALGINDGGSSSIHVALTDVWACNSSASGFAWSGGISGGFVCTRCFAFNNATSGFSISVPIMLRMQFISCAAVGNVTTSGFANLHKNCYLKSCVSRNNVGSGYLFAQANPDEAQLDFCTSGLNSTAGVANTASGSNHVKCVNCTFSDTTKFTTVANGGNEFGTYSVNDGNVAGAMLITGTGHVITQQTAVRHTASGTAWKIAVTSSNFGVLNPCRLKISELYYNAGTLVTVKAWVRRDSTSLTLKLVCPITGGIVTTEQSATISAAIDTWEELTITFTPAVAGVVPIFIHAYGGTTLLGYVDDESHTQAA